MPVLDDRRDTLTIDEIVSAPVAALPPGYSEPFAVRVHASKCCAITAAGKRCASQRRLWNPNTPEKAAECCIAHTKLEFEARRWMAAQQR